MACDNYYEAIRPLSVQMFFAVVTNQMEERVLKNKLGSIEQEQKRLMKRYRSETRLLKIKQEQRIGNLSLKRQDTKGAHIKGSPSPKSSEVEMCFSYEKRQSPKCFCASKTFQESGNPVFLTQADSPQTIERLPRLTCQSPTNQKEDSLSPHRISSETSTCFVTEEQAKQNRGPPRRRETWNGKTVTKLCASLSLPPRIRSFSEQDARSSEQEARSSEQEARFSGQGARLSDDMQTHLAHQKDACASENDSTTTGMQQNRICKMAFPTAEDVQGGNFLSVPKLPVRRACSLNSLKSVESLPPVFRNQDGLMVTKSSEVDWNEEEVAPYPLPICSKQTNKVYQSPDGAATNKDFLQRRHRPLRRQENLLEDTASVDAISILCKSPIKSPRACSRSETDATRKMSLRRQSSRIQNGHEEEGQETALVKDTSLKKGKITARSSSLSSFCAQEDKPRMKVTKKGKQESLETRKEDLPEPLDKSKWLTALKKVFNVNMFLGGMVALQKQKERDRLAVEQKQAELEKLYEELKHCRYLRLPSGEDDNKLKDTVAWVFSKE